MPQEGEVTRLLSEIRKGDEDAAKQLVPIVYKELRRMAGALMRRERAGHTLQPTAVVHEAFVRMTDGAQIAPENRAHFFAMAGRVMRQVLVDHARRRLAEKRGGEMQQRVELEDEFALTEQQSIDVLALHEALKQLQKLDERQAKIVEMHYFAEEEVTDIAQALGVSERTVKRELQTARLYLKQQLASKGLQLP